MADKLDDGGGWRRRELAAVGAGGAGASRTLVGALFELLVVCRLLDQVENGDRERGVGQRVGLGVDVVITCFRL